MNVWVIYRIRLLHYHLCACIVVTCHMSSSWRPTSVLLLYFTFQRFHPFLCKQMSNNCLQQHIPWHCTAFCVYFKAFLPSTWLSAHVLSSGLKACKLADSSKAESRGSAAPSRSHERSRGRGGSGGEVLIRSFVEYCRLHIANLNSCLFHSSVTENLKHAFQLKTRINMDL